MDRTNTYETNEMREWREYRQWRDECFAENAKCPHPRQEVMTYAERAARDAGDRE